MANPEIILQLAARADAERIASMSRDLIETGLGWSWTPARVTRSIECADTVVLVARAPQAVAGFAIMDFGAEEAHLNLLAVDSTWQQNGLGKRLVQWLEESALVAGISVVYLEVRATNKGGQTFYERLGYRHVTRVAGYYCGRESAIRMGRDLWCTDAAGTT